MCEKIDGRKSTLIDTPALTGHQSGSSSLVPRRVFLIATAASLLSSCGIASKAYRFRYKLTVTIETPHGDQVGSGVFELRVQRGTTFPNPGDTTFTRTSGDAFPVRIGEGRVVYILRVTPGGARPVGDLSDLMKWEDSRQLLRDPTIDGAWRDGRNSVLESLEKVGDGPRFNVPIKEMPAIAFFDDPLRPESGRILDPLDLSAVCGTGCRVKRCEIELTSAPLTRGIAKELPWVPGAVPRGNFAAPKFSEHRNWFTS